MTLLDIRRLLKGFMRWRPLVFRLVHGSSAPGSSSPFPKSPIVGFVCILVDSGDEGKASANVLDPTRPS